jgi:hypothetical protein
MRAGDFVRWNHDVAADNSCVIKGCSFTIADGCTALLPNRTIAFESMRRTQRFTSHDSHVHKEE